MREEITIGRQEGNTIRLTERNVSRRHARLVRHNGSVLVEDLGSYNGIRINGEKISGQVPVNDGDLIQIGDYDLAVQHDQQLQAPPPAPMLSPADDIENTAPSNDKLRANGNGAMAGHGHHAHHAAATSSSTAVTRELAPILDAAPLAQAEPELASPEDVKPVPAVDPEVARRQSTSIIRVDQIEGRPRQVVDVPADEQPRLVLLNTDNAGREYACVRSELKIGRTDENDIGIDHRSLSRTHCKIVREEGGEWRVIDMQSANGLTVNGEPYAQATLRTGDVIELGHVKFKFIGAGEAYAFSVEDALKSARRGGKSSSSKAPLIVVGILVAGGIAGAAYIAKKMNAPQPVADNGGDETPDTPPDKPDVVNPPQPEGPSPDQKIAQAQSELDLGQWEEAKRSLQEAKLPNGRLHPKAEQLLKKMSNENEYKANLDKARAALDANKPEEAAALLAPVEKNSELLKIAAQSLRSEVSEALQRKLAATPKNPETAPNVASAKNPPNLGKNPPDKAPEKTPEKTPEKSPTLSPVQEAQKFYEEGSLLARAKQFREARGVLEKCIKIDPTFALCHKLLGGVNGRLNEPDKGLYHYKMYLKLAPNDKDADKVRNIVEAYEASRKP